MAGIASISLSGRNRLLAVMAALCMGSGPAMALAATSLAAQAAAGLITLAGLVLTLSLAHLPATLTGALAQITRRVGRSERPQHVSLREWGDLVRKALQPVPIPSFAPPTRSDDMQLLIAALERAFAELQEGNFTYRMTEAGETTGHLAITYNQALLRLSQLVSDVSTLASDINLQSGDIARASEDLAKRTETNALQLETGSRALSEVDSRLQETAEKALATASRASAALVDVHQGHRVAQDAVGAMQRVQDSAKGIAAVIGGLDKIAFQTRVLAMNAAIEASRAGEAGRGFTVVADLVNSLAQRAEEESRNARDQLNATQADIGQAVAAVREMDVALSGISAGMSQVDLLLQSIAEDNRAQSDATSNASAVIRAMDSATQQNAATAEQAAAASRQLHDHVASLLSLAQQFRAEPVELRPATTPPRPARSASAARPAVRPTATASPTPGNVVPLKAPPRPAQGASESAAQVPQPLPPRHASAAVGAKPTHAAVTQDDDWQDF
ncbi:MAG: hypothetical protein RIS17_853 [Pseudomonadota bacterium]